MNAAAHTPGPWLLDGHTVYALMHAGWRRGEEVLTNRAWASVQFHRDVSDQEAAATLSMLVAAEDMLTALKQLEAAFSDYDFNTRDGRHRGRLALIAARAAIAKAEGGAV